MDVLERFAAVWNWPLRPCPGLPRPDLTQAQISDAASSMARVCPTRGRVEGGPVAVRSGRMGLDPRAPHLRGPGPVKIVRRDAVEERACVGVLRRLKDGFDRPGLHDLPVTHHEHAG